MQAEQETITSSAHQRVEVDGLFVGESMDPGIDSIEERFNDVTHRLERIEYTLNLLVRQRAVKEWYTTSEVAQLLGKAEFTVREWCRLGRANAQKRASGYGRFGEWMLSHEELERIRNHGLLPLAED